ncbi:PLP-dependent aminotransferase family protein [Pigmentiphaga aceris]|uniref:PLP-dependent aminotransferase family protein n=1 Tax=Pigmentiphaga aceris TaxID=1940612 RepID=A0A5C0AWV2_9BURK|nr:PLP-dependent aminotransferase family protein [Pigmentiphaga aceris]QEI04807.1 PLP-dependent aminotransferase family protein [Pigmentiphaga aceris]
MNVQFSQRALALKSSAIRELLKITERPEVISFAGGLPSPATFPIEALREATDRLFANKPHAALQYGPTEGYMPLREWVAAQHGVSPTRVMLTTGSQQALDLIGKVLIDPDSPVLVETPTYLGALQAFSLYGPRFVSVPSDEGGVVPEALTPELTKGARFAYILPNFQNPTGRTMDLARRKALIAQAEKLGLPIVEDNPYGDLSYTGDTHPTLLSMAPDSVIYLGSFSKILAPGLRLGYVIAPEAVLFKLGQAKQAADLHTPGFTQRVVFEAVSTGLLDTHIPTIRSLYAAQCAAMMTALDKSMPAGVSWNRPTGGMFTWVTLPTYLDATALFQHSVAQNVAYVPGAPFYANQPETHTLRLSFVTVPEARIHEGIAILGSVIGEQLRAAA